MSVQDFIKKSILESGAFDQATIMEIFLGLMTALLAGALIYLVYSKFYVGVIYCRSFAITLVGMTVLTAIVTLAISTNIVISLGYGGCLVYRTFPNRHQGPYGSFVSILGYHIRNHCRRPDVRVGCCVRNDYDPADCPLS